MTVSEVIGRRYIIQEVIGEGGMGIVYRANDRLAENAVALKRVLNMPEKKTPATDAQLEDFRLALAREFKILASLRHPNIISVQDYGFDAQQQPYFTMELLERGQSILEAGRGKSPSTKVNLLVQTLYALAYLHRRDILHRDLKPANVLVAEGQAVKVLDFGLASMRERAHNESDSLTAGTLLYMAPEIIVGSPATEASDLYAVGIMAYELLAGYSPFVNTGDVAQLINDTLYTFPDTDALDIPYDLKLVLDRLLQKDPQMRYDNAMETITAISASIGRPIEINLEAARDSFLQAARFVGRDAELKLLTTALENAVQGTGSAWLISGESGVGKSRLLEELRTVALVEGTLVMRGQALHEGGSPYQIWRTPARWLELMTDQGSTELSILRGLLPTLDENQSTGMKIKPKEAQDRLLRLFVQTLSTQSQPIVMILEDLHWASAESLQVLSRLVELVTTLPIMIIASYRDDEAPTLASLLPTMTRMKLTRLNETGIAQLSEAMLGSAGKQPQVLDLLKRETEGNIFFLIEIVRTLAEEAGELDQIGQMTLPQHVFVGGMKRIIERRLTNIAESNRTLLRLAAAMGRHLDLAVLKAIMPNVALERWLSECTDAAVLEIFDEQWRFVHDKLRDGLVLDVSSDEKQVLHQQIAAGIEQVYQGQQAQPAALAYHWGLAGNLEKESVYLELAGQQALASGAYQEAIKHLRRALLLIERQEGNPQVKAAHIRQKLAEAQLGLGGYAEAEQLYRASLETYQALNQHGSIADVLNSLGDIAYAQDQHENAKTLYEQSLALYRDIGDQGGVAAVLNNLGNVAYDSGEQAEAKRLYQTSLNISRERGEHWGMAGAGAKVEQGEDDEQNATASQYIHTRRALIAQVVAYQKSSDSKRLAEAFFKLGDLALNAQRYTDAIQDFRKCLALYKSADDQERMLEVQERLGMAHRALEDFHKAWGHFRDALTIGQQLGTRDIILRLLYDAAELSTLGGEKERAMQLLAFILNDSALNEVLENRAERLSLLLEAELEETVLERAWERGKGASLDDLVADLMH